MSSVATERPDWRFSLRLALGVAALFTVVIVALYFGAGALLERALAREEAALLLDRREDLRIAWQDSGEAGIATLLDQLEATTGEKIAVRIEMSDHTLLSSGATAGTPEASWGALGSAAGVTAEVTASGGWTATALTLESGDILRVARFSDQLLEVESDYRGLFKTVVGPLLLVGIGGGMLLVFFALRPLRSTVAVMRHIIRTGDWSARVEPPRTTGEMRDLADSFNAVLGRQQVLVDSLRQSLDNVSHDLRTPLTHLRSAVESGLAQTERGSPVRELLADCVEEAQRVQATLDTLLDVAEAEAGAVKLRWESIRADKLLAEVAELYEFAAEQKGAKLAVVESPPVTFAGDAGRLRRALANLVDNALKYLGSGHSITLSAIATELEVVLEVKDDGIGIPPEDMPRIWDRLFRSDRSRSAPGMGLGLSLVKAIAEAHGGRAEARSTPGQGSVFRIHLPLVPTAVRPAD